MFVMMMRGSFACAARAGALEVVTPQVWNSANERYEPPRVVR